MLFWYLFCTFFVSDYCVFRNRRGRQSTCEKSIVESFNTVTCVILWHPWLWTYGCKWMVTIRHSDYYRLYRVWYSCTLLLFLEYHTRDKSINRLSVQDRLCCRSRSYLNLYRSTQFAIKGLYEPAYPFLTCHKWFILKR